MERALSLYEKFNNRPARGVKTVEISLTTNLVDLGPCVAVVYSSKKEGSMQHYEHKFSSARLLVTEDGRTLIIKGAKVKVTDWIRG